MQVEANMEAEQLKLLGRSVAPMDVLVAEAGGAGLKIFIEDSAAIDPVARLLEEAKAAAVRGPRGVVSMTLMGGDLPGEIEMDLGDDFAVSPQIKGAIKSLDGVILVEDM